jgi:hypothetical protein
MAQMLCQTGVLSGLVRVVFKVPVPFASTPIPNTCHRPGWDGSRTAHCRSIISNNLLSRRGPSTQWHAFNNFKRPVRDSRCIKKRLRLTGIETPAAAFQLFRLPKLGRPWPNLGTRAGKVEAMGVGGAGAEKSRRPGCTPQVLWPRRAPNRLMLHDSHALNSPERMHLHGNHVKHGKPQEHRSQWVKKAFGKSLFPRAGGQSRS